MTDLYEQLLVAVSPQFYHLAPAKQDFLRHQNRLLHRIQPSRTLSVSLTDTACEQQCAHCNGHYLNGMTSFTNFAKKDLSNYDALLLSGGSNSNGAVDFTQHLDEILQLPEHLKLNLHPGYQAPEKLQLLTARNPVVSFDLPGCAAIIKNVFKLPYSVYDYRQLYRQYNKIFNTVPHITIGLNFGASGGESATVDFLAENLPSEVVFIIFRPTPGTEMADVQLPAPELVIQTLSHALKNLKCPIKLGCMRPAGNYRRDIDILAWMHGIEHIVLPHQQLIQILTNNSVKITVDKNCCALVAEMGNKIVDRN